MFNSFLFSFRYPVLAGVSTVGASTSSPSSSTEMSHNVAGLSLDVKESRGTSTVTPTDPPTMALTDAALSTAMKAKVCMCECIT